MDYGDAAAEIGWWEEPGKDNVLRLVGRKGTLPVTVRVLPPLDRTGGRKQLAHEAREAIAIARALERDKPVALFPEGTTGPGTHLLPFRSTLLEAANFAAKDVAIRPVAMDYGAAAAEIGWWEEPGKDNVLRLVGRKGTLPVTVRVLAPLDRSGGRKRLTHEAREAIAERLGFKSHSHSPIGADE
jgi:1-acyl-sn-glycerol-3-phosphate acyltransferase